MGVLSGFFFFNRRPETKKNREITHTLVSDGGEDGSASLNLPQREGTHCDTSDDTPFHSPALTPVTRQTDRLFKTVAPA